MIRQLTESEQIPFAGSDPFLTRILSLYDCYGTGFDFVRFFVQYAGESPVSCLSVFEGRMTLYLTDASDTEEIERFVLFSGCTDVMYDAGFMVDFNSDIELKGDVLVYQSAAENSFSEIYEPDPASVYDVLKACASEYFRVPSYLPFLSDVTHRKNKGRCTVFGIDRQGVLASCAMTVSEAKTAVIIGAVATRPAFQNRGLSRRIVISLSEKYAKQNKTVYVFSANEKNTRFYENSGFQKIYRFSEKRIGKIDDAKTVF